MNASVHIAVDLGAESGRVIVGVLEDRQLDLHEVHRFVHRPVPTPTGLCWDLTGLWGQMVEGVRRAAQHLEGSGSVALSVGVDSWGVDWTLVSGGGSILGLPGCYREPGFAEAFEQVTAQVSPAAIYDATGIQLMSINTLYQYQRRYEQDPAAFEATASLLFMPDLFHWLLSGVMSNERTIASTSQMLDVRRGDWNRDLLNSLGLPTHVLQSVQEPGAILGGLSDEVAAATGLAKEVQVVLPGCHDTASAVVAAPVDPDTKWCYLSSGTWSLLGAELDQPCITKAAEEANFTNELGVAGKVRFLKNLSGLWLVQEIRRQLAREGLEVDYAELTERAANSEPFRTLIPANDPAFAQPGHAIERLRTYARQSDQPIPESTGQLVRCCLESLALEYRRTLDTMESVLGRKFEVLHILGGGARNGLLNQMTADAIGRPVVVGPEEATAMGNLLTQAMGLGLLSGLDAMRDVARRSVQLQRIEPEGSSEWAAVAPRYEALPPVG